jgi:hypothetical protein
MNDIIEFSSRDTSEKTFNNFMAIFSKGDRLVYVGIAFVLIAVLFLFIQVSS